MSVFLLLETKREPGLAAAAPRACNSSRGEIGRMEGARTLTASSLAPYHPAPNASGEIHAPDTSVFARDDIAACCHDAGARPSRGHGTAPCRNLSGGWNGIGEGGRRAAEPVPRSDREGSREHAHRPWTGIGPGESVCRAGDLERSSRL